MKKPLILILLTCLCLAALAASRTKEQAALQKAARHLAQVLADNCTSQDITPDSFYYHCLILKAEIQAEQNPVARSLRQAALAHLLTLNAWRAQTVRRDTPSSPDSIREWSREEYYAQAAELYAAALRDPEALHSVSAAIAKPLVTQGKDDAVFAGDLLHLVWHSARQDLTPAQRAAHAVPGYTEIISLYRRHHLPEAVLQLQLDSLDDVGTLCTEDDLLRLRDEHATLEACAQVYLRLALLPGKKNEEQEDILRAGLARYPRSPHANALQNLLRSLHHPVLSGSFHDSYYPGTTYGIPLQLKNMQTGSLTVWQLPMDFSFSNDEKAGTRLEQVRRHGTILETIHLDMSAVGVRETRYDTLQWHTPRFGRYALVLDGTTREKLEQTPQPQIHLVNITALACITTTEPDGLQRIMVTDAMSGQPQQSVKVRLFRKERQAYVQAEEHLTDERGIVRVRLENMKQYYVELTRGQDQAFGRENLGTYYRTENDEKPSQQLRIYTDRSIYRPGQTVYVSGIAYTQSHEQSPRTQTGARFTLTLRDPNGQEVVTHNLRTDDFGTFSDSLCLPQSGLPGRYSLRIGTHYHGILVEEYRRPTFEVEMDDPHTSAVTLHTDSITITGRACTLNGWPVAAARVTGTYKWQSWRHMPVVPDINLGISHGIDTLYTDEEGRFSIRIPVSAVLTKEQLRFGQRLQLNIDVLSREGEIRQGSTTLSLCSTPLRMTASLPAQECRESLQPWRFDLYASNDKTLQGDILCMLTQNGKEVRNFILPSGKDTIPPELKDLPSGQYELLAKANVNGDTASFKATFTTFSITDKRLQGEHELWIYTPCDTISDTRPATFQVGTTLSEAWIYCIMAGENGILCDTILHLSDQAIMFSIPYKNKKLIQHHLSVTLMLMHEGRFQQKTIDFKLEQPDTRLRMHWDTFRNHLQPGQNESWRLTLMRPDGQPASANVIVGMYDASLDALASYGMNIAVSHACNRQPALYARAYPGFEQFRHLMLNLPLHFLAVKAYDFSRWNEKYFQGTPFTRGINTAKPKMAAQMAALDATTVESAQSTASVQETGGTYDDAEAIEEETETPVPYIRSNLSELAFFYPQLRTDSNGQTSIDFTLPEGLTSWHLHGLAHTKDMMTTAWEETIIAKKELMAELNLPRFLRNGDEAILVASVRNASEKRQTGEAVLDIFDAEDNRQLKQVKFSFDLEPGKEAVCQASFKASIDHPVLAVQWTAKGKDGSDGEVRYLPVLSDMQNVTETKTYMLRGDTTFTMDLSRLFANENPKVTNKALTIEHVSEPVYLALQALPSLTAPVCNDVLSVASAYYGGSIAHIIAHKYPKVRETIEAWGREESTQTMESPLIKNQELADIVLNETPWVMEAKQQKASRQRLATVFSEMEQEERRMRMLATLSSRQHSDGSFSWFPGMNGNVWMTSEVAMLLTRIGIVRGRWDVPESQLLDGALSFLETEQHKRVGELRKEKNPRLSFPELRYLYIYIMYREGADDDVNYLLSLLKKQAEDLDREERALAAIILNKVGEKKKAQALMPRLHELLRHSDGMYLAYPGGSFVSIDRKVETHVNLMEAVQTVEPKETELLAGMTEWLLLQKRIQEWERPVQSADAIYALLQTPQSQEGTVSGKLTYDNKVHSLQVSRPYSGYVREQIEPIRQAKELRIEQSVSPSSEKDGGRLFSWGAVYARYQMPAAEAESHREGMTIRRELPSSSGESLTAGSRIHVRYVITADRDYEYVCLRAPRPAAAEPAQQLSGYHWQNGLGYYQAMHDAGTDYFMDSLPRGTYVIEEDWLMSRDGSYLLPPSRLTCLYAPEFQSQTSGVTLTVSPAR
ncbi:MAG: hypothetical protein J1F27_06525 [Prevotellaceae bacterium]|nr:hypothetical protein [Prevotellaceae bacterium]